jgi:uncharacterized membrane protein
MKTRHALAIAALGVAAAPVVLPIGSYLMLLLIPVALLLLPVLVVLGILALPALLMSGAPLEAAEPERARRFDVYSDRTN